MADYFAMDSRQCAQELDSLRKIYEEYAAKGLKLDMSRGKPAPDQLDLSMELLTITDYKGETGIDSRNYGNSNSWSKDSIFSGGTPLFCRYSGRTAG